MSLSEEVEFDNRGHIERFPMFKKFFLALVILLIAGLSFGLGLLYGGGEREGIQIEYNPEISNSASVLNAIENSTQVVASKNGKKYHYLHCPGTKQISETNKIVFVSSEVAETSGYTLASNCKPR
ncbi:MAG: hypothetical protein A3F53_02085 [Candidatus Zambryskibacteria bacterium RIFCSPHIGHO2_12_FULL_48_10]|uniref:Ada DNA repair metal-binding domain-containing protein n=1 Tax=Candidatus Zambryskibacteria bacterium RIFCSPHIGHO2_01_FULL_46_25 TaxID=1802738 RepID=A0A1G2SZ39_9BACT|nr:MAG: Endonuclease I [Parcubacteria group bacterium GW2011_GWA1_47_10]OHA90273.1 MAG: hypothetical protein A2838_01555 [Candidatus Zambryskibacteria bacterium RIFCSPHIGHO2_01_FULL_46_25]OHB01290.1 MAG: hypothetical protein A3F53_02085 [Candidatus Zambryskibacteria bacterium RIFCSPHIGHO2_12_FULL_48_10]OHB06811.1 MAG: hypothetical protein A3A31_00695 [Candidatus Zambryskibacteria bacterium RIFCSPLOWO2_01_FULL_48_25]